MGTMGTQNGRRWTASNNIRRRIINKRNQNEGIQIEVEDDPAIINDNSEDEMSEVESLLEPEEYTIE